MEDIEAILSGFVQGYGHFQWFLGYIVFDCLIDPILECLHIHTSQAELPKGVNGNGIAVVAVGYGRTGTVSFVQTKLRKGKGDGAVCFDEGMTCAINTQNTVSLLLSET